MIIDLPRFVSAERPAWEELEKLLNDLASSPDRRLSYAEARRFHYLYQKTSADLGRVATFASEPDLKRHLESLVARAYAEIHETRRHGLKWHPVRWLTVGFPAAFRRRIGAFWVSLAVTLVGCVFGGLAVLLDEEAKEAIVPQQFAHVMKDPRQRVAEEESADGDRLAGGHAQFAATLMTNNISVSIRAVAFGMSWGVGTILLLFYNGVLLGLVSADFIQAGQSAFLFGWILPHGSIELPAVIIAGQGGLVLASALFRRGDRAPLSQRLRAVSGDVATIIGGVAVMLVWAGFVESYFSQNHQPRLPYALKIGVGLVELAALIAFLSSAWWRSKGRNKTSMR